MKDIKGQEARRENLFWGRLMNWLRRVKKDYSGTSLKTKNTKKYWMRINLLLKSINTKRNFPNSSITTPMKSPKKTSKDPAVMVAKTNTEEMITKAWELQSRIGLIQVHRTLSRSTIQIWPKQLRKWYIRSLQKTIWNQSIHSKIKRAKIMTNTSSKVTTTKTSWITRMPLNPNTK